MILVKGAFTVLQPNIHTQTSQCGWTRLPGRAGGTPATWDPDTKEAQGEKFINELGFVIFPSRMFRSNFRKKVFVFFFLKRKNTRMASQPSWGWWDRGGSAASPLVPGQVQERFRCQGGHALCLCPAALPTPGLCFCLH